MESVNFRSERDLKVAQLNPLPLGEAQSWERDMARSRAEGLARSPGRRGREQRGQHLAPWRSPFPPSPLAAPEGAQSGMWWVVFICTRQSPDDPRGFYRKQCL